eukprot:RCo009049
MPGRILPRTEPVSEAPPSSSPSSCPPSNSSPSADVSGDRTCSADVSGDHPASTGAPDNVYQRVAGTQKLLTQFQTLMDQCEELRLRIAEAQEGERLLKLVNGEYKEIAESYVLRNREAEDARKVLARQLEQRLGRMVREKEALVQQKHAEAASLRQTLLLKDTEVRELHRREKKLQLLLEGAALDAPVVPAPPQLTQGPSQST